MGVGKSTFTFSTSNITIDGGSTTIDITRDNQSYSHKLGHGYGEIASLAVGTTSYTYKPTAAQLTKFFQEVPAQKTRLIDIYLDTYNNSTKVGRDSHALTVTLSEATGKPSISNFTITDSNTTTNGWGVIVDGKSTLTAAATPSGKYGATISRNVFTCTTGGETYESYYINDLIASLPLTTTPTAFTIGYKSTDSRGFSNTVTLSKTVAKYQAPAISTFEIIRCNTSGAAADNGTKAKVIIKGSWAAMKVGTTYKNGATLKVGYKTKAATSYTYQTISVSAGTVNISQLLSATLTAGTDYEFSVELKDSFTSDTIADVACSNSGNILYVSADGKEMVIGSDNTANIALSDSGIEFREGSVAYGLLNYDSSNHMTMRLSSLDGFLSLWGKQGISIDASGVQSGSDQPIYIATPDRNGGLNDWVVVEGTSGVWTYRKWASGLAECWGNVTTGNFDISANAGSGWYYNDSTNHLIAARNYPFTFMSPPSEYTWITIYGAQTGKIFTTFPSAFNANTASKTRSYQVLRIGSLQGVKASVQYYAKGMWK